MVTLTNDFLTATLATHGAELTSLVDNHSQHEYIWQADPTVWQRHAPVLFPFVGALKDKTYRYQGQDYHMGQHGFARDLDFTVAEQSQTSATFVLSDTPETRANYPFAFKFAITFTLENNTLAVAYHVENPDADAPLYFSVGGHPGFNVPMTEDSDFTDYYLSFAPRKSRVQIPLTAGGIDYAHRTLAATDTNLQLDRKFFKNDAAIYQLTGKNTFSIRSEKTTRGVDLTVKDAQFMGVWSPYTDDATFVCLEPWWGIADTTDTTQELTDKLGINKLEPGATFDHGYVITTH
ncbi:aldose 1-epimerase family protein [Lacticaseibacillus kribbianus]|uniref:aldose 1-epimerase family protein n=1 Tax=Lacticaseibacillus kribbianus TaxID=2926292 RepID=UPI001CD7E9C5|nr:aldose 1-epimerase family protein [Lacticaseibacillus kribbianus]